MSKPLKTVMNVVSGSLQSDLWEHSFDKKYGENENYKIGFSSLRELLAFDKKIEGLLSSIHLKNTGERLNNIMDTSAPYSWLSVVLARAKTKLSEKGYILKFNDYNGRWEIDKQEKKYLEEMIDDVIKNLHIMYVMLVENKADDVVGINGKHYFWEKEGRMKLEINNILTDLQTLRGANKPVSTEYFQELNVIEEPEQGVGLDILLNRLIAVNGV